MRIRTALLTAVLAGVPLALLAAQMGLPNVQQVLDRYEQAVGGRAAVERLTTRAIKGKLVVAAGEAKLEIYEKAPDRIFRQIDSPAGGISRNGFDGKVAWSANAGGVREVSGPEVEAIKREYCLHREIRLREFYPAMEVTGRGKVGDREVYVVAADPEEKFYFDVQSGLLLRWDLSVRGTAIETYYEDYREVDGARLAFRIRRQRSDGFQWTEQFEEIRHNAALEDARFLKPAAPAASQEAGPAKAAGQRRSLVPDTFTNLQVLPKDIRKNELVEIMRNFCFTMDQRCSYCHVATDDLSEADFPADDKEPKKKARELLRLILSVKKEAPKPQS